MKSKVLFWYEEHTVGNTYTWMDRFIAYFGLEPRLIDTLGHFKQEPGRTPVAYPNLNDALEDLKDHSWIFLDSKGEHILDEFEHPEGPSVYAFGSDSKGFGCNPKEFGTTVRLRNPDEIYVLHALPLVLYDRALRLSGRH